MKKLVVLLVCFLLGIGIGQIYKDADFVHKIGAKVFRQYYVDKANNYLEKIDESEKEYYDEVKKLMEDIGNTKDVNLENVKKDIDKIDKKKEEFRAVVENTKIPDELTKEQKEHLNAIKEAYLSEEDSFSKATKNIKDSINEEAMPTQKMNDIVVDMTKGLKSREEAIKRSIKLEQVIE